MRALLVEDDPATREMIGVLLGLRGHDVAAFGEAETAWKNCQREFFPLIILDWMLPGQDGLELCRQVRSLPDGENSVILVMTARSRPHDLAMVLEAGANDYVAKPFDLRFFDVRLTIAERHVAEVTARKQAERARDEALSELKAVVEGATESILVTDLDGVVRYASPATERVFGLPAEAQIGRPFESALAIDESTRAVWRREFRRAVSLPPDESRAETTIEIPRPEGGAAIVEIVGVNLANGDGRVNGRLFVTRDATDRERHRRRREALLRVARGLAAQVDPERLQVLLLSEAVEMLEADDGTIRRWDEPRRMLATVHRHARSRGEAAEPRPGAGACGLAIEQRAPVVLNDYQQQVGPETSAGTPDLRAAVAAPLLYEGRLLGALVVQTSSADRKFSAEDAEVLELLASLGSAALVGLERARLEGALLAARTAQHELSNQLALTVGHSELLTMDPALSPRQQEVAAEALRGAEAAADILHRLQRITHLTEIDWGPLTQPTIDIQRSAS